MPNKIYIFAIGGTGSRVLRAFTMLMASGVKLPNGFDTVVPVIIDPDTANGDMNRTADILSKYQQIHSHVNRGTSFFSTTIKTLYQLLDDNAPNITNHFKFNIEGASRDSFADFIGYSSLDSDNKAFIDLLFTPKNLASEMSVGFKGNPNIGSIVLNQFTESREYKEFAKSFNQGDAIFIISSIFGGTGASGFPLLLKNLRTHDPNIENSSLIKDSIIGAISYLPYFKLALPEGDNSEIDSSSFFMKAKAALSYYDHSLFGNNSLNAFYYLGDNSNNNYENHDGKAEQKNNAHFLELAGALSILDFLTHIGVYATTDGKAESVNYKEFGVEKDTRNIKFNDLGNQVKAKITKPLSKLMLLTSFLDKSLQKSLNSKDTWHKGAIHKDFFNHGFYQSEFLSFMKYFKEWVAEIKENDVAFEPFHENQDSKTLLNFINDYPQRKSLLSQKASDKKLVSKLNKISKLLPAGTPEEKFFKLFDEATETIINKIIK